MPARERADNRNNSGANVRKSRRGQQQAVTIEERFIALLASLFFSIPTAVLIWLLINKELAFTGAFLASSYLWMSLVVFAALAFAAPTLFSSILGAIWRWLAKVMKWLM